LATNGIDLPVLNVFRMFAKLSGTRIAVSSDSTAPLDEVLAHGVRERADVSAIASLDHNGLYLLMWHYHEEDLPGPAADVSLTLDHLPIKSGAVKLEQFQIDAEHSNAIAEWKKMDEPSQPTPTQLKELQQAGRLDRVNAPQTLNATDFRVEYQLKLPRQAVALLHITWPPAAND
jgi:xylan 1,4-beta-xylosidase